MELGIRCMPGLTVQISGLMIPSYCLDHCGYNANIFFIEVCSFSSDFFNRKMFNFRVG